MERRTSRTVSSSGSPAIELQATSTPEIRSNGLDSYQQHHNGYQLDDVLQEHEQIELKPVDGGRDAWQLLISAFIFEALFWGFPTSYGVFQAYYTNLPQFADNTSNVAVIGTLAQGLAYLGAPFSAALTKRFPRHQKVQLIFGWSLCIVGLLTASFANNIATLIVTQGMVYGLGFIVHTYPILNMVNEWWITRKGMAFGLISAASGLTGVFMPLVLEALLHRYGYQITLRGCAIAMFVLTAPMIPLLRGRLPPPPARSTQTAVATIENESMPSNAHNTDINTVPYSERQIQRQRQPTQPNPHAPTDWTFLKNRQFYIYLLAMTIQGLGFFIPPIFLTSYAISIGIPSPQAASLLAVMALFQTLGQFAFGSLSDKNYSVGLLASTCCLISTTATLLFWGLLGKNLGVLMLYAVLYGFFAFGFSTLRVAMGRAVTKEQSSVLATYSIFVFVQGIGNVLVGPVAGGLMKMTSTPRLNAKQYGANQYKETIIFVAGSSMLGALVMIVPRVWKSYKIIVAPLFG